MASAAVRAAPSSASNTRFSDLDRSTFPASPRSSAAKEATSSPSHHYTQLGRDAFASRTSTDDSHPRRRSRALDQYTTILPHSPEPPTLLSFASSFQSLLDSQAPTSSSHSAYSELLSVSHSAFPPSTLPISALTDLVSSSATPSTTLSSKSSSSSVSTLLDTSMSGVGATAAGLDLLGILAEAVDWDPQHKGAPGAAQLALLGQSLQSHHEAKQKLWAGQILGSLGLIEPDGSRRNSFSTLNASELPKAQRRSAHYASAAGDQKTRSSSQVRKAASLAEDPLNTMTLTKRTALFYENLYEHLCPGIVPRAYIYPKLGRKSHDQDPSFAALALSISLLGLLGVTLPNDPSPKRKAESSIEAQLQQPFVMPCVPPDRRSKAHDSGQLRVQAMHLIERILKLRLAASGGGVSFGQSPTLETVLTGFFLSLALYNLDDATHEGGMPTFTEWKDASFFRFCETITLAKVLGLDQVASAATSSGDVSEEAMVWSMLVRAERWWAEQKPGYVCQMEIATSSSTKEREDDFDYGRKRVKKDEDGFNALPSKRAPTLTSSQAAQPMEFLIKLGFANVRDALLYRFRDLIDCWSHHCSPASCAGLTSDAAVCIHDSLASLDLSSNAQLAADPILIDLARQALRAMLWIACLNHNLVSVHAQGPLRPDQPLHIALDTLDLLEDLDQLVLRPLHSDAALGDAIQEALQAIRNCVSKLPQGQFAAETFSFEQIEGSDESESPPGASPHAAEDEVAARSNSTTITRAAQSVMENLDRFLNRVVAY